MSTRSGGSQFGNWLKTRRHELDLTQEEFARRVGYSWETIRRIESGERPPSKQLAELLADFFGIPPEQRSTFVRFARSGHDATGMLDTVPPPSYVNFHRPPNNLPAERTPFVGRESALATCCALVLHEGIRLLTLSGPAGIGKTRLSLKVANALLDRFPDGVYFVPLGSVTEADFIALGIGQSLSLKEPPDLPFLDYLKSYLRGKKLLLVLDNLEQIRFAGALIADLMAECPSLKVLTTSRALLHIYGEHEFPVPPLLLPDAARLPTVEVLQQYEAVQLFAQRSRTVKPDFEVTRDNASIIVEICRRLDGLPLAIELAAARIKLLAPSALLIRLSSRLSILTRGPEDLPPRQRTLRGAIAWSYDLLDLDDQALFRQLGVFVGGFTVEAVESVFSNSTQEPLYPAGMAVVPTLDRLASLVDKSLLIQQQDLNGEPRFAILETIREFAVEQLEQSGEADNVRLRYASFYQRLAEEIEPHLTSAQRDPALKRLDLELTNLREVLSWSLSPKGDQGLGLLLVGALHWFWYFRGYLTEGRDWTEKALEASGSLRATPAGAKALMAAGRLALLQDDYRVLLPYLEENLSIWRTCDDNRNLAYALAFLGLATTYISRDSQSGGTALLEEAVALFRQLSDTWSLAFSLDLLADGTLLTAGPEQQNIQYREESLRLYRQLDDKWGVASELLELGNAAFRLENFDEARASLEEALVLHRIAGDKWHIAHSLLSLGLVAWHQKDHARATYCFEESISLYKELQDNLRVSLVLRNLGHNEWEQGHIEEAARLYQESLKLVYQLGSRQNIALSLLSLALVAVIRERPLGAALLSFKAEELRQASHGRLPSIDRVLRDRNTAALTSTLSPEEFERMQGEASRMTIDEVVQLALGEDVNAQDRLVESNVDAKKAHEN